MEKNLIRNERLDKFVEKILLPRWPPLRWRVCRAGAEIDYISHRGNLHKLIGNEQVRSSDDEPLVGSSVSPENGESQLWNVTCLAEDPAAGKMTRLK